MEKRKQFTKTVRVPIETSTEIREIRTLLNQLYPDNPEISAISKYDGSIIAYIISNFLKGLKERAKPTEAR
jgi:hypothetical protein